MLRGKYPHRAVGWLPFVAFAAMMVLAGLPVTRPADAKSPGKRYCFHGYCHRVGTLAQTDTLVGWRGYVLASYYDSCGLDRLNPCGLTSSGAVFRPDLPDNAASPLLPDGTVILAYNPKTGDGSVLRVTNAGPYSGQRKLDVSRAAADRLGFRAQGVAPLVISVLQSPTAQEASYVRRRVYPSVAGHLGKFSSFERALEAAEHSLDVDDGAISDTGGAVLETASLSADEVPKPRLAVSPSLARELVMLRTPPRAVNRIQLVPAPQLVQGPRIATASAFFAARALEASNPRLEFANGMRQFLPPGDTDERD